MSGPTRPAVAAAGWSGLTDLGPIAQLRAGRLALRLPQLYLGLALYGVSLALMIRADLGVAPWDVLHTGLTRHLSLTFGQVFVLVSVGVLLLWIPLRETPGLGTVSNPIMIGVFADLTLALVPAPAGAVSRLLLLGAGLFLNGLATALYIGSQFGRGPRDGLMTGLHRRTGRSLRLMRTAIELSVVALGLVLGGVAGIGTILYAVLIGPLTQFMLPACTVELPGYPAQAGFEPPT